MRGADPIAFEDTDMRVGNIVTEDIRVITEVIQDGVLDGAGAAMMKMRGGSITEAGSAGATTTRQFLPDEATLTRYARA